MATNANKAVKISQKHLLGIQDLSISDVKYILSEAKQFISLNRSKSKKLDILRGKTQINLFFEPSTRTQSSFELAGKRLGADVMSMNIINSAIKKGETLIDTAMTLNAMHPDIIVIRHQDSGACNLLSQKVNCAVLNAGDGRREHPTQALLDALTIIEKKEKILEEKKDKINIYKCCLIKNDNIGSLEKARMILKIPVFTDETEMRVILEYHELGQIWILDNEEKNLANYFLDLVIKFSVDIFIVNFKDNSKNNSNLLSDNLINNKYSYSNYQTSRFYGLSLFIKIFLDKIFSIIFLLLVSPIFILAMIFILIEDGFPILFSEESPGWDGRRFYLHKLRTLKKDKLDITVKEKENDKTILKIGKIIRILHIDEIPQFFNVLKGDMSIVGPRPHEFQEDLIYSKVFKKFLKRNKTSPGLTGWAQIHGYRGSKPTSELMKKRMEYDLWYMNNWNIWLDIYIILKTFQIIFTKPKS